jgi:hypothetical protein
MARQLHVGPASSLKALGVVAAVLLSALALTGRLNPGSSRRLPAGASSARGATISSRASHVCRSPACADRSPSC